MTVPTTITARTSARPGGFVSARDGRLVGADGAPTLFRGVGLGNWLLPEGYMWRFPKAAQSPREIEAQIIRLAGAEYAHEFWTSFRQRFITEADVARIAASGFDHVRLPINARVLQDESGEPIPDGYAHVDRLIGWCGRHGLYVLLDLHGAPGGQTGTNIDDSARGRPDLFLEPRYRDLTAKLWRTIAERYCTTTVVMGYDLLNEPLPNKWQHRFGDELRQVYRELTATIRAVDGDHLLMYEGSHWATNWDVFTEVWDENSALQFHKYWSAPDRQSLAPYLEARERLGLPIYMGEGGENTLEWLYTAFRLYESEEIGWNLWPWKKLETHTSPASAKAPAGWGRLVDAMAGRSDITPADARATLDDYLDAIDIKACEWREDVVAAVLGTAPRVIPAWGYGFRGPGQSYGGAPNVDQGVETASPADTASTLASDNACEVPSDAVPAPPSDAVLVGFRADDAVVTAFASGSQGPENPFTHNDGREYTEDDLLVVRLGPGQWLEFELARAPRIEDLAVVDAAGADVPAELELTVRGLRVSAPLKGGSLEIARVLRADALNNGMIEAS